MSVVTVEENVSVEANDLQTELGSLLPAILQMSQEFFSGPITVETISDPDDPSESWIELNVESKQEFREIIKTECAWHERLARYFPIAVSYVRLGIYPIE